MTMRTLIANTIAKSSKFLLQKLKLGQGSALPGRLALKIAPDFLSGYNNFFQGGKYNFFVSGTNGKTTTSGLLANIIKVDQNKDPINNAFGANLYYGIVSEIVNRANLSAELNSNNFVFELDEAAFRSVAKDLKAKSVVLTNIYRDQLDRFGEIDATQKLLIEGLNKIDAKKTTVFLNANDNKIFELRDLLHPSKFDFKYYFVKDIQIDMKETKSQESEAVSHDLDCFQAELLERSVSGSKLKFSVAGETQEVYLPIAGDFNIFNATAAAASAYYSGVSWDSIKEGIETYESAFGRGEKLSINDKELNIFLIKNPAGCTEVLSFVSQFPKSKVMIAINDDYADGLDVSWLWDAKFEYLKGLDFSFICSGRRAYDMALRLKYAGIDESRIEVEENIPKALKKTALESKKDETTFILPTYTSLLAINKIKEQL